MKSWNERLHSPRPHQVKLAPMNMAGMKEGQIMLIPTALMVDEFIREIPAGTSMDIKTMRQKMAGKNKAEISCPITTGILLRIVAEATWEDYEQGAPVSAMTPVWRVLDATATTTKKLSFDAQFLMDQRKKEGILE
ncbi:MAG: hypothetical protein JKY32_11770 [Rhizobiales bacterium]|nr:hypothetical protein [Hyphomicrobiales bacterium]